MKKLVQFFFLFCLAVNLHANLEKYFKKAEQKATYHNMRNIDFIYMINLDQRPEKFASCEEQLRPFSIYPYRFSAVNGWELSLEAINEVGVKFQKWMYKKKPLMGTCYLIEHNGEPHHEILHKVGRNYFCHCMARGSIGIVLSHLSILQDAYDSGYKRIWVMEDDIEVIQNPHKISEMIDKLDALVGKDGWDILFTDRDTKGQDGRYVECTAYARKPNFEPANKNIFKYRKNVSHDFRRIGARYGAYSMIVNRCGIMRLLHFIKRYKIFLPYDMEFYLLPGIRLYTVRHDIVSTQPNAPSDNGGPNYMYVDRP